MWCIFLCHLLVVKPCYLEACHRPQMTRWSLWCVVMSDRVRKTAHWKGGGELLKCYWQEQNLPLIHTDCQLCSFRVACSERVYCANVFRMGSNNSSFTTNSRACSVVAFLAGIIFSSVDSTFWDGVKLVYHITGTDFRSAFIERDNLQDSDPTG